MHAKPGADAKQFSSTVRWADLFEERLHHAERSRGRCYEIIDVQTNLVDKNHRFGLVSSEFIQLFCKIRPIACHRRSFSARKASLTTAECLLMGPENDGFGPRIPLYLDFDSDISPGTVLWCIEIYREGNIKAHTGWH